MSVRRLLDRYGINPQYRRLWLASGISNLGDGLLDVGLPLLAATLTRDPAVIAGVATAAMLPWLIFPLISGALADRWDRRKIMVSADTFRGALLVLAAVAVYRGWMTMPIIYAAAFLMGIAQTLFDTTSQSVLPAIVERDDLERANGRLYATEIITNNFAGKPLGGLLFAAAAALPVLFDGVSFLLAAALVLTLRGSFVPRRSRVTGATSVLTDIRSGLSWLWNHRLLRTMAIMVGVLNLASSAAYATFVLFSQEVLGLGDVGFGLLLTAGAVGGVIGSMTTGLVTRRLGPGTAIMATVGVGVIGYGVIAMTGNVYVVAAMLAATAAGGVIWNVVTVSFRQVIIPDELLGRINSVYRLFAWGSLPLGALAGGFAARTFSLAAPFWMAACIEAAGLLATYSIISNRNIESAREAARREVELSV